MIRSCKDKDAGKLVNRLPTKRYRGPWAKGARIKLELLNAAVTLQDLAMLPGLRLEKLKGDREGQHSIGINDQYRSCFKWVDNGAEDVEIVDYH